MKWKECSAFTYNIIGTCDFVYNMVNMLFKRQFVINVEPKEFKGFNKFNIGLTSTQHQAAAIK